MCGRTLLPKEANVKRARHTLLFDPKLESSRGRTTPINEGIPAPETPRNWRIAWRVIQLRYVGWTWDSGFDLPNPPRTWTDNYLKSEGRGLIGFAKKPDFQLKDVLPHWTNDGWFWWKVQKPHTVYSSGNVQMWK